MVQDRRSALPHGRYTPGSPPSAGLPMYRRYLSTLALFVFACAPALGTEPDGATPAQGKQAAHGKPLDAYGVHVTDAAGSAHATAVACQLSDKAKADRDFASLRQKFHRDGFDTGQVDLLYRASYDSQYGKFQGLDQGRRTEVCDQIRRTLLDAGRQAQKAG